MSDEWTRDNTTVLSSGHNASIMWNSYVGWNRRRENASLSLSANASVLSSDGNLRPLDKTDAFADSLSDVFSRQQCRPETRHQLSLVGLG